jgi:quercetin dioxygenase-like cupin family protein
MNSVAPFWLQLYQQSQQIDLHNTQVEHMQLNHDLSQNARVNLGQSEWLPSPAAGVKRLILEREGGEKTIRATSIVAYAPNSKFAAHSHPKGEEFYVLAGTFSDQYGDYPAGSYVRNPPGSSHAPFSQNGCLIWVKLQQFSPDDNQHCVISTFEAEKNITSSDFHKQSLFDDYEGVDLLNAQQDFVLSQSDFDDGVEILILVGQLSNGEHIHQQGSWLRFAAGRSEDIRVSKHTQLLVKSRHLRR